MEAFPVCLKSGYGERRLPKSPMQPCQAYFGFELILWEARFILYGRKQGRYKVGQAGAGVGRRISCRRLRGIGCYLALVPSCKCET